MLRSRHVITPIALLKSNPLVDVLTTRGSRRPLGQGLETKKTRPSGNVPAFKFERASGISVSLWLLHGWPTASLRVKVNLWLLVRCKMISSVEFGTE